jgi:MEDS: MEthanogen/methylotroph, DcmR Sensory domain
MRRTVSDAAASAGSGRHIVHFYSDEQDLAQIVARRIVEAVDSGGIAFAAAAASRLHAIEAELGRAGFDLAAAHRAGAYIALDPEPTARRVIADGSLDREQVGAMAREMIELTTRSRAPRFMYGEVAPWLWEAGMVDAALELEARTDDLVARLDMTVMCGYRTGSLFDPADQAAVRKLCHHHTYLTSLPFSL